MIQLFRVLFFSRIKAELPHTYHSFHATLLPPIPSSTASGMIASTVLSANESAVRQFEECLSPQLALTCIDNHKLAEGTLAASARISALQGKAIKGTSSSTDLLASPI